MYRPLTPLAVSSSLTQREERGSHGLIQSNPCNRTASTHCRGRTCDRFPLIVRLYDTLFDSAAASFLLPLPFKSMDFHSNSKTSFRNNLLSVYLQTCFFSLLLALDSDTVDLARDTLSVVSRSTPKIGLYCPPFRALTRHSVNGCCSHSRAPTHCAIFSSFSPYSTRSS
jgi:hypothetical protein